MQETNIEFTVPGTSKPRRWPRILFIVFLILMVITSVGIGVYQWQRSQAEREQQALQQQIDELKRKNAELEKELREGKGQTATRPSLKTYEVKFSELGVKIAISEDLEGVQYNFGVNNRDQKVAILTSTAMSGLCPLEAANPPLGALMRVEGQYKQGEGTQPKVLKQFDDFYVAYYEPQRNCSPNDDATTQETQNKQVLLLEQAMATMKVL